MAFEALDLRPLSNSPSVLPLFIAVYIDSLVIINIEKSERKKEKNTGNLRQICLGPWPMLSLWQKSGTNFMV